VDGRFVVFRGGASSIFELWDSASAAPPIALGDWPIVKASADGSVIAFHCHPGWPDPEGRLQLWEPATNQSRPVLTKQARAIKEIVPLRDGRLVAVETTDSGAHTLWNLTAESILITVPVHGGHVCISAGSGRCAFGQAGRFEVWDLTTRQHVSFGAGGHVQDRALALSADGRRLATYRDHAFTLWDVTTPEARRLGVIERTGGTLHAFSPDGRWFGAGMPCEFGELHDVYQTEPFQQQLHLSWAYFGPNFAPDSRTFVAEAHASPSGWLDRWLNRPLGRYDLEVWDPASAAKVVTLLGCEDFAYTPDGQRLVVARGPDQVEVWDVPPRRPMLVEYGLPVLFCFLMLLLVRQCARARCGFGEAPALPD
jgi:hypothetical protein